MIARLLCALVPLLAVNAVARADIPADPAVDATADAIDEARTAFEEGIAALDARNCEEAITLFRRSIELSEGIAASYNLGVALETCGQVLDSVSVLEGLLVKIDEGGLGEVEAERRAAVDEQLRRSLSQLGALRIELEGAVEEAQILVDGSLRGVVRRGGNLRVSVDPGRHHIEGRGAGVVLRVIDQSVGRGEVARVVVEPRQAPVEFGRLAIRAPGMIEVVGVGSATETFDERLPVGTYEVHAAGETRSVDVRASGLSRLDFEAPTGSRRGLIIGIIVGVVVVGAAVGLGIGLSQRDGDFDFVVR